MLSRHACLASSSSSRLIFSRRPRLLNGFSRHLPKHGSIALRSNHDLLVSTSPGRRDVDLAHNAPYSGLGLRSQRPPDSLPDPKQETPPEVPDQEWEIRTGRQVLLIGRLTWTQIPIDSLGRAIFVIQETLPDFFTSGLITSIDKTTGSPHPSPSTFNPSADTNFLEHYIIEDIDECIYSPNIRLSYTPPVALPAPFPKTLRVEGISNSIAHWLDGINSPTSN